MKAKFVLLFNILITFSLLASTRPYVILISFDGFRWDYPNRGLTPNFDYIKQNGAHSLSLKPSFPSKTFPNHISIITGMYPENHGIILNHFSDLYSNRRYSISDSVSVTDSRWYTGETFWETAAKQGIKTASYFWPGSEMNLDYRRPTYFKHYDHDLPYDERINGAINWLKLPYEDRPHFITMYFDAADTYGHRYGPDSKEINETIPMLDSLIGKIFLRLKEINLFDSTNIIIVSDHGMTAVDNKRQINVEELLKDYKCDYFTYGTVMLLQPDPSQTDKVFQILSSVTKHFQVYKRESVPLYYHFSHSPLISELVLIANPGWELTTNKSMESMKKYSSGGDHGFDNNFLEMHGIFYAIGPGFKKGYATGTLNNVDIYPLLCKIFNIIPRQNIDGQLERIEFLLR